MESLTESEMDCDGCDTPKSRETGKDAIQCDKCSRWVHDECYGHTSQSIQEHDFQCRTCLASTQPATPFDPQDDTQDPKPVAGEKTVDETEPSTQNELSYDFSLSVVDSQDLVNVCNFLTNSRNWPKRNYTANGEEWLKKRKKDILTFLQSTPDDYNELIYARIGRALEMNI